MSRSLRVRADLVPRVELAIKRNGFIRKKDLVEALEMAESTVRNFRKGKPVDHAVFVEICQKLNLEWQDFADFGEITELHQASEEAVIARYSTSKTEKTTPDTFDLAEREEAIAKPQIETGESNENLIEERFFRATEQLNRRGFSALVGIQALEEIAKDSSRYHWKIMELLAAFVRNAPPRKEEKGIPDDIQAALTVIGRRNFQKDPENQRLNLSNTDLRGVDLKEANLQWANLYQANLQGTILIKAQLQGADLGKVNLKQANLIEANLQGTILTEAQLQGAFLSRTNLQQSDLMAANLEGTQLSSANLQMALLKLANLQSARLCHTQLQGADIRRTNFSGASLLDANLEGAYIELADFRNAHQLTQKQIDSAKGQARLPDYLKNQRSSSSPN